MKKITLHHNLRHWAWTLLLVTASPWANAAPPVRPAPTLTATNLTVSTLTTGTVFAAWPYISSDGRYVGLNLQFSQSMLEGIDTYVIPNNNGLNPLTTTTNPPPTFSPAPGILVLTLSLNPPSATSQPARSSFALLVNNPAVHGNQVYVSLDRKLFDLKLNPLHLENMTLAGAIKKIAGPAKTNVVLSLAALKKAGVDVNQPINLDLPAGTLRDALQILLEAPAKITPLVITAEDNVVFITSQDQADHVLVTKSYYVEDLVNNLPLYIPAGTNLQTPRPAEQVKPTSPAAGTQPTPATPPITKKPASSTNLLEVITTHIRPEIWKANGGKIGEIYQVRNQVTITAPQSVHAVLDGPKHYNPNQVPRYISY